MDRSFRALSIDVVWIGMVTGARLSFGDHETLKKAVIAPLQDFSRCQ